MQLLGGFMGYFPQLFVWYVLWLSQDNSRSGLLLRFHLGQEAQFTGFEAEPTVLRFLSVVPAASSFYGVHMGGPLWPIASVWSTWKQKDRLLRTEHSLWI